MVKESFINDSFFADDFELIPGGWGIKYKEIKRMREYKDFHVMNDKGSRVKVNFSEDIYSAYLYYYQVWDNCRVHGLPGGDWTQSPPWVLGLIRAFNTIHEEVQHYLRR